MTTAHTPLADSAPCPCGSGEAYGSCCAPLHRGRAAATPEALMRSRYSAFAVGDAEYLRATWHPSTRPPEVELDPAVQWRRLDIVGSLGGAVGDDAGEVEFRAFWRVLPVPGRDRDGGVLHERSRFVREGRRWYYMDGDILG
ncbi:YchJ family protein [Rathayibacter sp. KR2-224]|uniref:YchJ family protein n=1 Tax=Rathayibacter sp. KR2-224 TaxID=3400913 RepID=UPI003C0D1F2E